MDVAFDTRAWIGERLARTAPELQPSRAGLKIAAVLIPIVERAEPTVLFTRRTDHLSAHAGQICFPGGRFAPDDATLVDTALREAEEEIGIPRDIVTVAGFLDPYESGSGFAILPVVGFVPANVRLALNADEVAEIFEVPLKYLRDPKNRERRTRERDGEMRSYHAIQYDHHTIWGLTAALAVALADRLGPA